MKHSEHHVAHIGKVAGLVWDLLAGEEPISLSQIAKRIDEPRDVVMQAVGWLAREDKLRFEEQGRTRLVALK